MASHSNYHHDRPATEDSLSRSHFAKALSRSLVLPIESPGLVVGIEGEWGSGKSTLIGFITKNLSEITDENLPIVIDFNPWMVSSTGVLVEALIVQIAASIGKDLSVGEKGINVSQKLINYVRLLKPLKYIPGLSFIGHIGEDLSEIAQGIANVAEESVDAGQKTIDDFKRLLPTLDLSQKKNEVITALGKLNRPIVIVVDDLDRLPAEEIRAMIQAIKAVADFPRITYLLAYDRSIIARALAKDKKSGLSYLEKIVQVAYPIPPLSQRQLKKFASDKMQALLHQLNINLRPYEEERYEKAIVLLTQLVRHPRDVIRIINRLILSLPATHGEVNAADVIVFEALSQRFPALREAIHNHSIDFIGHFFRDNLIDEKDAFDWGYSSTMREDETEQAWLKHLPKNERDQHILEKACSFLFSKQEDEGNSINYEDHLRIADPDRLARLFRMTSIEEIPEAKQIHELLTQPQKLREELLEKSNEDILFLLDWMINYTPSCPAPDVMGCIKKLIEISEELTDQCKLVDEVSRKFADLMNRLLRLKKPEYKECFLSIFQEAPLSISENIICLAATQQGKWIIRPESKVDEDRQLISDSALVDQAIQKWSERVRECISQGNLYKEAHLHSILYRFAQFNKDNYEETYKAIDEMCKTEKGLSAFLRYYEKESFLNHAQFKLIEDAEKLRNYILDSSMLKKKYHWLIEWLSKDSNIQSISNNQGHNRGQV